MIGAAFGGFSSRTCGSDQTRPTVTQTQSAFGFPHTYSGNDLRTRRRGKRDAQPSHIASGLVAARGTLAAAVQQDKAAAYLHSNGNGDGSLAHSQHKSHTSPLEWAHELGLAR